MYISIDAHGWRDREREIKNRKKCVGDEPRHIHIQQNRQKKETNKIRNTNNFVLVYSIGKQNAY